MMTLSLALSAKTTLVVAGILAVYGYSLVWVFGDARRRGESGVALFVGCALFFWPLGLCGWLIIRPPVRPRTVPGRIVRRSGPVACAAVPHHDDIF